MNGEGFAQGIGMITSRECPSCGHHEVGFVSEDGTFHPLKPGTLIQVLDIPTVRSLPGNPEQRKEEARIEPVLEDHFESIWLPGPLKGNAMLRLKYGVLIRESPFSGNMSEETYRKAYREKLQRLVEKERHIPLPVLLDRYFAAPHLASGDPEQVTEAMWHELDEIKIPVHLVGQWLERQDEASFLELISPVPRNELEGVEINDEELRNGLEKLSLEEFLRMLTF